MDEVEMSDAIARSLAWVFPQQRESSFLDYLSLTYSEVVAVVPAFECVCVAEAECGDVRTGEIGGIIKRWWLAGGGGCRPALFRDLPPFVDDFNSAERTDRVFYRFPLIKFLREEMTVAFGETFGPRLVCRKIGHLQQSAGGISIVDVRLVWNVKSLGRDSPLPLMSPTLDIDDGRAGRTTASTRVAASGRNHLDSHTAATG